MKIIGSNHDLPRPDDGINLCSELQLSPYRLSLFLPSSSLWYKGFSRHTVSNWTIGGNKVARMSRENAERIICQDGWLAHMPEPFRARLLQNALLLKYEAGQVIFRPGDPAGGIYGLVAGTVTVDTAPRDSVPHLIHIALPGGWTGEDSFMTGEPRRIELCARSETWVMHVPLQVMEQMAASDPKNIRAFGVISILSSDVLLRVIYDLQKRSVSTRIASVLHRMSWTTDTPVSVSQENLGVMANASRKQVNSAVKRFADEGWIDIGYRSITVRNILALRRYAEQDIAD